MKYEKACGANFYIGFFDFFNLFHLLNTRTFR